MFMSVLIHSFFPPSPCSSPPLHQPCWHACCFFIFLNTVRKHIFGIIPFVIFNSLTLPSYSFYIVWCLLKIICWFVLCTKNCVRPYKCWVKYSSCLIPAPTLEKGFRTAQSWPFLSVVTLALCSSCFCFPSGQVCHHTRRFKKIYLQLQHTSFC